MTQKDNIKIDLTKLGYEGGRQMELTHNHIQCLALEIITLNRLVSAITVTVMQGSERRHFTLLGDFCLSVTLRNCTRA